MRLRIVSSVLACSLALSGTAFAGGIRDSIPGAVERNLAEQARQRGRGDNPMMIPGIALIGGGGLLMALGLMSSSGVECTVGESRSGAITGGCDTKSNKGLIFAGLGAAGVGGFLLMRGAKQRNSSPYIMPTVGGVSVGQRLSF